MKNILGLLAAIAPITFATTGSHLMAANAAPSPAATQPALPYGTKPWDTRSPFTEPTKPAEPPSMRPQIGLKDVLGANNLYHDEDLGITATYPSGWKVASVQRWGTNNSENTARLEPDYKTTALPSMYYQEYPNGYPELEGATAYFRRVAQNKENQRISNGVVDYKNVESSFEFTEINGNPALSYFAVFNRGNEVHTEFFIRILGKRSYVMFFVPGRMEDVKAMMPQIKAMAATVKMP